MQVLKSVSSLRSTLCIVGNDFRHCNWFL